MKVNIISSENNNVEKVDITTSLGKFTITENPDGGLKITQTRNIPAL